MLVDTHCHIHEASYSHSHFDVIDRAVAAGVDKLICVGTDNRSSREACELAANNKRIYCSVGIHPHEVEGHSDGGDAAENVADLDALITAQAAPHKLVAIGEIGLDYFYMHAPKEAQQASLRAQLSVAVARDLPVIFHVRDAFDDFWPIFDSYDGKIRGVLHSYTDSSENLARAIDRGLYIGVNGISTFTKDTLQRAMYASIPLERLVLETDAPFLTPVPLRGKVNEPAFVTLVAEHQASIRGISLENIASQTTANAHALFAL